MVVLARRAFEHSTAGEYVRVLAAMDSLVDSTKARYRPGRVRTAVRVDVRATEARVLHLVHYIHY